MLIWHVDAFVAEPTERGRSKLADAEPQAVRVGEALVVFAASEKTDEPEPDAVAERAVAAVVDVARRLGEKTIVLHSFAHLFVELSTPATAKAILEGNRDALTLIALALLEREVLDGEQIAALVRGESLPEPPSGPPTAGAEVTEATPHPRPSVLPAPGRQPA
jgi:hypothetical protein